MPDWDIAIIGAGIAGAGIAHALLARAPRLKVLILEAEDAPGRHTTGRSAAFFSEAYGGPAIQPLTSASRAFLEAPPKYFAEQGFLSPRGALYLKSPDQPAEIERLAQEFSAAAVPCKRLGNESILRHAPHLLPEWSQDAIYEPGCADIDVAALHQALLRSARRAGAILQNDARVEKLERVRGVWHIATPRQKFRAGRIFNAAGAWADEVAALAGLTPIGLQPLRRTIIVADADPPAPLDMPIVLDSGGSFYMRPDTGRLWLSPHDETPDLPHDVQPDEYDIASTIDRFESISEWRVRRIVTRWAGLRTFAPDRRPVIGPDPGEPTFLWAAGQGGWGIQTAPAMSDLIASFALGEQPFMDAGLYMVSRFR